MHDITEQVAAAVASSAIRTGNVNIFNVGSTAAIDTIEFEPGLERDLPAILDKQVSEMAAEFFDNELRPAKKKR